MSHHHCNQGSCDVSGCQCSCHKQQQSSCGSHHCHDHEHEHGSFAHQLLELADEAWMEVLKEKIKAHVGSLSGNNLDELAKLVAESNHARWTHKLGSQKCCDNFEHKIDEFFKRG